MTARFAEIVEGGSVFIAGGDVNLINIQGKLPAAVGVPIYYIAKLEVSAEESGRSHNIRVVFLAPSKTILEAAEQNLEAAQSEGGRSTTLGFVMMMGGVTFPEEGLYEYLLIVDGTELTRTSLYIQELRPEVKPEV